ncbi:hypothetical protein FA09DRAFT_332764 [Tilletiopsis washingtonensis]|uniref:F-box domain-containing protein n=1 Tax=Tilletiopsis washingtonensis TaxID=58919 RepID=A0A316YYU0_9BASI|nr:hypothetical protein FA09DRAFT_332764 [Tilletiopsis washingtonensis]PWN94640.1 hypothetical protein FA09DRAFT_332764 [Tilletiopsis washingtonensis]
MSAPTSLLSLPVELLTEVLLYCDTLVLRIMKYLAAIRTTNTSKVQRRRVHSTMVIRSEGDEPITVEQFWKCFSFFAKHANKSALETYQDFRFKLVGLEHEKVVADGKYEAWIHPDGGSDDTDANGYTAGFFGYEW